MSPEQFEGQPVDGRSDQYSLGIMTWEALTGAVPFTGDSLGELIRKHLLEPPPRVADVNPDVPVPVSDAVHRAMSKKPAERFPDIAAFVEAFGGKAAPRIPAGFSGPIPVASPPASSASRRWRISTAQTIPIELARRRPVLAASVVVGLALAAGGIWIALHPGTAANGASPPQQLAADTPRTAVVQPVDTHVVTPPPRRAAPPVSRPSQRDDQDTRTLAPAKLTVTTQPWGQLFVDDRLIGNTPIADLTLAPGRHRVQVKRDGFVPFDTTFTAAAGQEIRWTRRTLQRIGG
jgi:serine/threonine-protein kinase